MKTQLIFFDKFENSANGVVRGLIAFISLVIFDIIRFSITNNTPNNIYAMALVYLIICSAIAVQLPKTYAETLVYGLLVGFVVYSVLNLYNLGVNNNPAPKENMSNILNIIINIVLGTISCGIASSFIYLFCFNKII